VTPRFKQVTATLLVAQLVIGPVSASWGQLKRDRGARAAPSASTAKPAGPPGAGAGTGAGVNVESRRPAEESVPGGQALSRAVVPDQYILGPGDGLSVNLWGEYNESSELKVTPDGKISLPTIGDLMVKGMSLTKANAFLEAEVKRYYRNVKSSLSLTSLRVFEVLVLGGVLMPGAYLATPVKRVSDVILQAGEVQNGASKRHIQVQRKGQVVAEADLVAFLRQGDETANPFLQDGDVVYVPPMGPYRITLYVTEVSTRRDGGASGSGAATENSVPYVIELKKGEGISQAVAAVGGTSPWWDLEGVFVERQTEFPEGTMRIPVNLRLYFYGMDESQDIQLQPGDQVYIPASIRRVFVAGSVKTPGAYPYFPGKQAGDYVVMAGGASLVADFGRSVVRRADGTVEPYNDRMELNNGDTVIVFEKLFKTWQDYFAFVGTISGAVLALVGFYAAFTNFGR